MFGLLSLLGLLFVGLSIDALSNDDHEDASDPDVGDGAAPEPAQGEDLTLLREVADLMHTLQAEEQVTAAANEGTAPVADTDEPTAEQAVAMPGAANEPETQAPNADVQVIDAFDPATDVLVIEVGEQSDENSSFATTKTEAGTETVVSVGGAEVARIVTSGAVPTAENVRFVVASA